MMPVRLCFENKKILSFTYTKEKNVQQSVWILIFSTLFLWYTVCLLFIMQMNITFRRFKKNLAQPQLPNPRIARNETLSIHLLNKSWLLLQKNAFIPKWYHFVDTTFVDMLICVTFHSQRMFTETSFSSVLSHISICLIILPIRFYVGSSGHCKKLSIQSLITDKFIYPFRVMFVVASQLIWVL